MLTDVAACGAHVRTCVVEHVQGLPTQADVTRLVSTSAISLGESTV